MRVVFLCAADIPRYCSEQDARRLGLHILQQNRRLTPRIGVSICPHRLCHVLHVYPGHASVRALSLSLGIVLMSDCAVCMDGYGSGVSNTCQHCDDTTVHVHIAMGALCAVVVISLLLPAVVYLIGGLGAIDIFRRSIARTRSVRSMTPIVPDQTPFEPSAGMDPVHTTASLVNPWTSKDKRRGGECGTKGPKAFSNNYSEPDGLARARAGLFGDDVGAVVKVPDVTSGRDPKHAVVSASRAARRNAVPKITVGGPHERREVYTEATNGGTSTCCAFGDKVKRSVSRLPLDKFKILVVVWQILAGLSSITGVEFPASYSRFLSWISVVNLDIGDLFSASCVLPSLTFYARLLASTLSPLLLMAVLVLTYRMAKRRAGLGRAGVIARRDAWSRHVAAGLLLTFLVSLTSNDLQQISEAPGGVLRSRTNTGMVYRMRATCIGMSVLSLVVRNRPRPRTGNAWSGLPSAVSLALQHGTSCLNTNLKLDFPRHLSTAANSPFRLD